MLRELYYQFLPYRSYAFPILVLSAIVLPCWLAFRLYRFRTTGRRVSFRREFLLLILVFYLVGLAVATLTPNRSDRLIAEGRGGIELRPNLALLTCSPAFMPHGASVGRFCEYNRRANLALFFPLGILIPLVGTSVRFKRGILIAIGLSFSIELVQYLSSAWGSYRAVDVNDFILNVFGAALGLALVSLLRWRPKKTAEVTVDLPA